jgi:hypothetical protein
MVPGMIERERLAADARRADWIADAAGGSRWASGSRGRFGANGTALWGGEHLSLRLRSVVTLLIGSAAARFRKESRPRLAPDGSARAR